MSWKVNFFKTDRGDCPVKEFIEDLNLPTISKITHTIELLEDYGPYLKPPYIKKMGNKFYELRTSGKIAVRIFYTICKNEYYLLHAFRKKSRKTPGQEIKTAIDKMKELI